MKLSSFRAHIYGSYLLFYWLSLWLCCGCTACTTTFSSIDPISLMRWYAAANLKHSLSLSIATTCTRPLHSLWELSLRNWYKISAQGCTRKYIFGRYQIQIISVGFIISSTYCQEQSKNFLRARSSCITYFAFTHCCLINMSLGQFLFPAHLTIPSSFG